MPIKLLPGGMDLFYVDESAADGVFVITAVRVPLLRQVVGDWSIVWDDYYEAAATWRKNLGKTHHLKFPHELHASHLLGGHGRMHKRGRSLTPSEGLAVYRDALSTITFLPAASIVTVWATSASKLYGTVGQEAAFVGLMQRLRTQAHFDKVQAMIFFDEGHDEYVSFFRRARVHLQTGSQRGGWDGGSFSKNLPLAMFTEDANIKRSKFSYFVQIADLVVHAAFLKIKAEKSLLNPKRVSAGHHQLYDLVPRAAVNLRATGKRGDGLAPV